MKGRTILLDHIAGREAAALLHDGRLDDLLIDTPAAPRPGAIFRAICDRPIKGQGGMILRLPNGQSAFLRHAKGLRPGQPLCVQVNGYAEQGKAVPVTDRILFKSRYTIITPEKPGKNISRQITNDDRRDALLAIVHDVFQSEYGLILRSSCEDADDAEIAEDIHAMETMAATVLADKEGDAPATLTEGDGPHILAWREWYQQADVVTTSGCFETHGVLDQLIALRDPHFRLGEGSMYVEPTRALVAVDVNTGNDMSPAAALKTNLAAAQALPRALRLLGLAGQIAVDFVSVSKVHRKQVEQTLRAAFRSDPIETSLVGWTSMGLFELQRKRERAPIPTDVLENL